MSQSLSPSPYLPLSLYPSLPPSPPLPLSPSLSFSFSFLHTHRETKLTSISIYGCLVPSYSSELLVVRREASGRQAERLTGEVGYVAAYRQG